MPVATQPANPHLFRSTKSPPMIASRLLKAKDVMTTPVVTLDPDDSITEAIARMRQHDVSGLPVIDAAGHLVGILADFDLLDLVWDCDPGSSEVYQYMTQQVHTADEEDDLGSVAEQFRLLGIRRLPVMRGQRVVGIISRRDLLDHLPAIQQQLAMAADR